MARYLLPCKCGHKTPVGADRAGDRVACGRCGEMIDVPPLRKLSQLERATEAPSAASPLSAASWDWRKGLVLVGLLVAVVNFGLSIYLQTQWVEPPPTDAIQKDIENMTPHQTILLYEQIRGGVDLFQPFQSVADRHNAQIKAWTWITCILGAAGLLLAIGLFLLPRLTRSAASSTTPVRSTAAGSRPTHGKAREKGKRR